MNKLTNRQSLKAGRRLITLLICISTYQNCDYASAHDCCEQRQRIDRYSMLHSLERNNGIATNFADKSLLEPIVCVSSVRTQSPVPNISNVDVLSGEYCGYGKFQRFVEELRHPVICPVYLCHGSCAMTDRPCTTLNHAQIFSSRITPEKNMSTYLNLSSACCLQQP
jgi:hypothetical protein